MQEIVSIISNMGFPIACCILLYLNMGKQQQLHQEEIMSLSQAIDNNTLAITKLCERLQTDRADQVSLNE